MEYNYHRGEKVIAAEAATNFKNYYPLIRLYALVMHVIFVVPFLLVYHFDNATSNIAVFLIVVNSIFFSYVTELF